MLRFIKYAGFLLEVRMWNYGIQNIKKIYMNIERMHEHRKDIFGEKKTHTNQPNSTCTHKKHHHHNYHHQQNHQPNSYVFNSLSHCIIQSENQGQRWTEKFFLGMARRKTKSLIPVRSWGFYFLNIIILHRNLQLSQASFKDCNLFVYYLQLQIQEQIISAQKCNEK